MTQLTEEEINRAYKLWIIKTRRIDQDKKLMPFLSEDIQTWNRGQTCWLKQTRTGLLFSLSRLAEKLQVSSSAYKKYEESERAGTITLATLAKAAEAMDCELVYAIRPKSRKLISQLIWEKLLRAAEIHPWLKACDQQRKSDALLFIATQYLRKSAFRKQQEWTLQKNK